MTKPNQLTIAVDSREQLALDFTLPTTRATLSTGDYSILNLEELVTVERKSLPDLKATGDRNCNRRMFWERSPHGRGGTNFRRRWWAVTPPLGDSLKDSWSMPPDRLQRRTGPACVILK